MQLKLEEFEQVIEKKADDRGRVTLGKQYAGQTVEMVVVEAREINSLRGDEE